MRILRQQLVFFTTGFFLFLFILYFFTQYKVEIAGIGLGLVVSFYNVQFLAKKLQLAGSIKRVSRGTGMLHRFSMVALAIMLGSFFPRYIDVRWIFIGLPLCYLFVIAQQYVVAYREVLSTRKG